MAPKKVPDVSAKSVESEICQLTGEVPESNSASEVVSVKAMIDSFLERQDANQDRLIRTLASSFDDLKAALSKGQVLPQRTTSGPACRAKTAPPINELFTVNA